MSIETALIFGFLFHFIGDYLLQNNWIAQNKTKSHWAAFHHAFLYSLLFYYLVGATYWWLIIFGTHFLIDRYRLAIYWIKLVNNSWNEPNFGYGENMPTWMSTWLMIIIDNTIHVTINSTCIYFCYTLVA